MTHDDDTNGGNRDHGHGPSGLTLLVAAAIVVAAGLFLSARIGSMTRLQDCLLSGRSNCAPVDVPDGN